jgi:aminomethyltransferase
LCTSLFWKDWAGYHAVCSYDTHHDLEYYALRHSVGLIDVTPLFKYEVHGPDAAAFLSWIMVKNIRKLKVGRVTYLCWCDDDGRVVDDGTVARLEPNYFRVTAAEPSLAWLQRHARGYDVTIEDSSLRIGALAVQGPRSRELLKSVCDADLDRLKYFGLTHAALNGVAVQITRTGYTGDLGYEVWVESADAIKVWDALFEAGRDFRVTPVGLDALDVSRVEAGYIMNGVDYFSAHLCLIDSRKASPYELGLGWTVQLDREPFIGQSALRDEKSRGPKRALVGLRYDWDEFAALFTEHDLPPQVPGGAWRDPVPVYGPDGRQVGQATSGAWSPILKCNLALATIEAPHHLVGTRLRVEVTVEYVRRQTTATVCATPFFDPPRKRA